MKFKLSVLLISLFSFSFSQKTVDAKIITITNDTLQTKVKVTTNMFDPTLIYGSTFSRKIKIFDQHGNKNNLEVSDIKELYFKDYNEKNRVFINNSIDKKSLSEQLYVGTIIDWYRMFSATNGGENINDVLYNKETKKYLGTNYFTGLPKKKLKEFFGDEPEMIALIEESKGGGFTNLNDVYSSMQTIIKKYESLKAKK